MGRTALNRPLVPRSDDFVPHPRIRQFRNTTDKRPMIARFLGARRDPIGHGAAVVEELIAYARVAPVDRDCLGEVRVRTPVASVAEGIAVEIVLKGV